MNRAAIYARFLTDLQTEKSIEDQIALCRVRAKRDGFAVVATYEDRALSGASLHGRKGLADLMCGAAAKNFDVVIVEELDRLSRDMEDLAGIYTRLNFCGIEIVSAHEGKADRLRIAIRGLIGSIYLDDLARKVRR